MDSRIKIYSMNSTRPDTAKRLQLLEEKGLSILPIMHPLGIELESNEEYLEEMKKREGRNPIE